MPRRAAAGLRFAVNGRLTRRNPDAVAVAVVPGL
ncbi:hypothetical protein SLAV_02455 [Streptomyces lavendulae subsp. lavendulae]|uniref:Uncharacterized protein n=1 Tax=Streptomyces lavendulae subsp. lavendulae TaxID=58340 RepID=A0A2K8P9W5_STRLA|nr:hypothetical protein SLAV_02455 [Streptomyces lavendulae subsp. lavendulae]QUQ52259.1 hypothetical protein SLLC_00485 [Streptomyces lavendulae subsp. lavendulae]